MLNTPQRLTLPAPTQAAPDVHCISAVKCVQPSAHEHRHVGRRAAPVTRDNVVRSAHLANRESSCSGSVEWPSSNQRRAVDGDFVAELADLDVADDEDGFVFAQFRFAGDQQRTVIYVGRRRVAGQEFEVSVAVAAAVDVDAFAIGEVEVYFDHAAPGI